MKRIIYSLAILTVILAVLTQCGDMPGKYADVEVVMKKMISAGEDYAEAVETAGSAKEYAAAINQYAKDLGKIQPQMEAIAKKYPEFKTKIPEELEPLYTKLDKVFERVGKAVSSKTEYVQDPEVIKASFQLYAATSGEEKSRELQSVLPLTKPPVKETPAADAPEPAETAEAPDTPPVEETGADTESTEPAPPVAEETTPESTETQPPAETQPETQPEPAAQPTPPVPTPPAATTETSEPAEPAEPLKQDRVPKPVQTRPAPSRTAALIKMGNCNKLDAIGNIVQEEFPVIFKDALKWEDNEKFAGYHLVLEARNMGSAKLDHYGTTSTQYAVYIHLKLVDTVTGRTASKPQEMTVKFTRLNEEENLKDCVKELLYRLNRNLK